MIMPPCHSIQFSLPCFDILLKVKIVGDTGKIVPINERGQLCVRGEEFLFIEYKDQPELTAQTKGSDGWMLTG